MVFHRYQNENIYLHNFEKRNSKLTILLDSSFTFLALVLIRNVKKMDVIRKKIRKWEYFSFSNFSSNCLLSEISLIIDFFVNVLEQKGQKEQL